MSAASDAIAPGLFARVWLPFALGYFISYGLRNINAVLGPELAREFSLGAAELGLLTGAYFVAFTVAQLPFGLLLDRYGPRRVNGSLLLVTAAGCLLSAVAPDFELVVLGRGLIGLGVSLCLMAGYKAHVQYFPLSRVQYANSLLLTAGSFGVMAAAWPVGWALEFTTWRVLLAGIAALVVVGSLVLFIVAPERVEPHAGASLASMAAGYKQIYASGRFWGPATTLGMVMGSFSAVQSLWLGTWLRDVALLDQRGVVAAITIIAFTSMIGYAVMGTFFDRLLRRGITAVTIYLVQGAVSIALFAAITFAPRVVGPVALWVVYGVLGAGGPIIYTIFAQQFPASLIGRVNTAGNLVVFALAFLFQWFVGLVLDLWPVVDGHYAPEGYRAGFAALLALQLVGYVVFVYGARHWLGRPRLTS